MDRTIPNISVSIRSPSRYCMEKQQPVETSPGLCAHTSPRASVCTHTLSLLPASSHELFMPQPEGDSTCVPEPSVHTPRRALLQTACLLSPTLVTFSLSPGMFSPFSHDLTLELDGFMLRANSFPSSFV